MKKLLALPIIFGILISFAMPLETKATTSEGITVHYKGDYATPYIYYWNSSPSGTASTSWPGEAMIKDSVGDYYTKTFDGVNSINLIFSNKGNPQTANLSRSAGEWWWANSKWYSEDPGTIVTPSYDTEPTINVHVKSTSSTPLIEYYDSVPTGTTSSTPVSMLSEKNGWYRYSFAASKITTKFTIGGSKTDEFKLTTGEWYLKDNTLTDFLPNELGTGGRTDFREESIYFVITTRFYDGDSGNNVHCWDDLKANNPDTDPAWRGDFKGLIDKLDYIKALGFSAIWITPVVENSSGYDYHGYHAIDFSQIDPRYETKGATFQDLINAIHAKKMKIIQDVVFNHTSNFGEENLFPMFEKDYSKPDTVANLKKTDPYGLLPEDYSSLSGDSQYGARILAMKEDSSDVRSIYHHEKSLSWESYTVQTGQIAGDCVDLNTENPYVTNYLIDSYNRYIDMGVDAFRVDTTKHISRLTFNKVFNPAFMARGGENFYMFGEVCSRYRDVWNSGIPAISAPFYTWKESKSYPWATMEDREASVLQNWNDNSTTANQPTSNNHYLNGNDYHPVDYSKKSGLNVIDFPMHWAYKNANDAFNVAKGGDQYYNDATWNVTYIDSHDYAPDGAPEGQRFNQDQSVWAENLSLLFSFRGIPSIFYGSEIEFQKGKPIDVGPNAPLSQTGRAYFGDHIEGSVNVTDFGKYTSVSGELANTLNYPLAKHIRCLNLLRRGIPALQKGQYSTSNISGTNMAFKRRFTDSKTDSFALVSISGGATFSSIPNGTYVDAVTGDTKVVTGGSLTTPSIGMGNLRVYVLSTSKTPAPGAIGVLGSYIK